MIGVFDSGRGGERAARMLHSLLPENDVLLYRDKRNAPFGTKSQGQLKRILALGINALRERGCDKILLACCTMCSVLPLMSEEYKGICHGIIAPTAKAALRTTKSGRIAVIATDRTVMSHAFAEALLGMCPSLSVCELHAQPLVEIAERGGIPTAEAEAYILSLVKRIRARKVDTVILGCTHFGALSDRLAPLLRGVTLVDSAYEGALSFCEGCSYQAKRDKKAIGKLMIM